MKAKDSSLTDENMKDFFDIVDQNLERYKNSTKEAAYGDPWNSLLDVAGKFKLGEKLSAAARNANNIRKMSAFADFIDDHDVVRLAQQYSQEWHDNI